MYSENDLAKKAVDVCFKIHTLYGPGLFESVYEKYFAMSGIKVQFHIKDSAE
jgi:hypothetical protein